MEKNKTYVICLFVVLIVILILEFASAAYIYSLYDYFVNFRGLG